MLTRRVESETLDHLAESDPRALASRRDLRLVNRVMGNLSIIDSLLSRVQPRAPTRIVELGAGDGSLLLGLAKRRARTWPTVALTFVDRQNLVTDKMRDTYRNLGWVTHAVTADVFDWLQREDNPSYDVILANLFIHHFDAEQLPRLFSGIARACNCFIACEPQRTRFALFSSYFVGALGANAVTRRDAVLSVRAGFRDQELSKYWPESGEWQLSETGARLLSHTFAAVRKAKT